MQCAVWRMVGKAVMRRTQAKEWIARWVPRSFHGGVSGRDVFSALCSLEEDVVAGQHAVASLDLAKAFDWVDPSELCRMMRFLGLPDGLCVWLQAIWVQQKRWISWRHAVSEVPHWAGSSLPQGDPFSPLGMMIYLTSVARDVGRAFPNTRLSFFADDRTLADGCAARLLEAVQLTMDWTRRLCVQENRRKLALLARTQAQRAAFLDQAPDSVVTAVRLLGIDLGQRRGQADRPAARKRCDESLARAQRVQWLPVPVNVRRRVFRQLVTSKFTWGWLGFRSVGKSVSAYWRHYKAAVQGHSVGSTELIRLLDGHQADACYTAGQAALSHLWRCWQSGFRQLWTLRAVRGTWQGRVREFLQKLGWTSTGPWAWSHPSGGAFAFDGRGSDRRRGLHLVRETWRRQQFESFLQSSRRGSGELCAAGARYSQGCLSMLPEGHRTRACCAGWSCVQFGLLSGSRS